MVRPAGIEPALSAPEGDTGIIDVIFLSITNLYKSLFYKDLMRLCVLS